MTQTLLDVVTLSNQKTDLSSKMLEKEYSETLFNGKSFSDILTKSNDHYQTHDNSRKDMNLKDRTQDNKFNDNDKSYHKSDKGFQDRNSTDTRYEKNGSYRESNNNSNRNDNSSNDNLKDFRNEKTNSNDTTVSNSKNTEIKAETAEVKASATTEAALTVETNTAITENVTLLGELNSTVETLISTEADSVALNTNTGSLEILIKMYQVTEPVDADAQINAYYQSAMDALTVQTEQIENVVETLQTENLEAPVLDEINYAFNQNLTTEQIAEEVPTVVDVNAKIDTTLKTDFAKTSLNADAKSNLDVSTPKIDTTVQVQAEKVLDSAKVTGLEQKADTKSVLNNLAVEVSASTGEETVSSQDVFVEATDDVMNNLGKIDVTKTEKYNAKEILEKAGLAEADLEAMSVKITNATSTETGNGAGTFNPQGSAQEELAKMAVKGLENMEASQKVDKNFSDLVESSKNADKPKELHGKDVLNQISAKMQAQNINGQQKITLMLTPESLGKVTIELIKGHSGIEAKMLTDNLQVKELLEKNLDSLKSAFGNQGVNVNSVNVKVASAGESSSDFSSFERNDFGGDQNAQQQFGNSEGNEGGLNYEGFYGKNENFGEMEQSESELAQDEGQEVEKLASERTDGVDLEV